MKSDNVKLAVASIMLSVLALSLGDAVIKMMSVEFTLWQIYVLRSAIALPAIVLLIRLLSNSDNRYSLLPISIGWTGLRSLLLALMWIAYYTSLPHIELSIAASVYYTIPLFITLFSALFTGDKVSLRVWFAIGLGFTGVLIIVRPQSDGFNIYILLPLLAAVLYALSMILTRTRCRDENPWVLSLSLNVMFILVGALATLLIPFLQLYDLTESQNQFLLGEWSTLNAQTILTMTILAAVVIAGSYFAAVAYQNGPPALVSTFDYSYLAFSAFWGFVFFSEIPDGFTVVGMLMIVVAGLIALRQSSTD